jgi:hypothetical protein
MFKKLIMLILLLAITGSVQALVPQDYTAHIRYNNIEFSYVPDVFGAVLPAYNQGTAYQADAPYFVNVAPHTTFKFLRPNPAHPDINFVGELRVYRIAELEAYPEPTYREAVAQLEALYDTDLRGYATADTGYQVLALPFLPHINATQVFRAQPVWLNFQQVSGIEYYTYYSQGIEPILEGQVLYVFQGITSDRQYYLSFSIPVVTGMLPADISPNIDMNTFGTEYPQYLQLTFTAIQQANTAGFSPAPDLIRPFIDSITLHE